MIRIQGVVTDIPGRDSEDGNPGGLCYLTLDAVEVIVDGFRLPSGVSEYGIIHPRQGAVGGQGEQGAGLNAGAEREGAELGCGGN